MSGSNGDIFDQARLPAAASEQEVLDRRLKGFKALKVLEETGSTDLVEVLGLGGLLTGPQRQLLGELVAGQDRQR